MAERQRALITGGGSGIGAALARHLAGLGLNVTVVGRRRAPLEEVRAADPERIAAIPADVADPEGRRALAETLDEPLDFLVHSAGVLAPVARIGEIETAAWRANFAVNVEAPLLLTQALIPWLPQGRVLNVSSGAALHPIEGWAAYCSAKAAQVMVNNCLNLELNRRGILAATARPGVVDTPMQAQIRDTDEQDFPTVRRFRKLHQEGQLHPPAEVAAFLAWLLLECGPGAYPSRDWDIDDPDHQALWKEG